MFIYAVVQNIATQHNFYKTPPFTGGIGLLLFIVIGSRKRYIVRHRIGVSICPLVYICLRSAFKKFYCFFCFPATTC